MAIIDWPTNDPEAFTPASAAFGSATKKSVYEGAYTGERQILTHLSDRLRVNLSMPPRKGLAAAGRLSALLRAIDSTGDQVRFGPSLWGRANLGTLGGTVTVGTTAAAGLRSITLAGALAAPNLLRNSSFELDTNSDGLADALTAYSTGTATGITYVRDSGNASFYGQQVTVSGLGATSADRAGFQFPSVGATAGQVFTASVDVFGTPGVDAVVAIFDGVNTSLTTFTMPAASWLRISVTHTVSVSATSVAVFCWITHNVVGGTVAARWDNVQLETGALASPYAGPATLLPEDAFSTGGNLVHVAYGGAVADDAGTIVVPLVLPLQKQATAGAAVTVSGATGVWQLDADGISLDYSPGAVQDGIALPFRQIIV